MKNTSSKTQILDAVMRAKSLFFSVVLGIALALTMLVAPKAGAAVPIVGTGVADSVTYKGANLNGTVNPNGLSTTAHFEYGTTTAYGKSTTSQSVGNGSSPTPVSASITGLAYHTTYHYRLVGVNSSGSKAGGDATFTTASAPPTVTTKAATVIHFDGATVQASVNPNALSTHVHPFFAFFFLFGTFSHFAQDIRHVVDFVPHIPAYIYGGTLLDGKCDAVARASIELDDFSLLKFVFGTDDESGKIRGRFEVIDNHAFHLGT